MGRRTASWDGRDSIKFPFARQRASKTPGSENSDPGCSSPRSSRGFALVEPRLGSRRSVTVVNYLRTKRIGGSGRSRGNENMPFGESARSERRLSGLRYPAVARYALSVNPGTSPVGWRAAGIVTFRGVLRRDPFSASRATLDVQASSTLRRTSF